MIPQPSLFISSTGANDRSVMPYWEAIELFLELVPDVLFFLPRDPQERNGISRELFCNYQVAKKKGEKENFEKIIRREIFQWNTKYLIFFSLIIIILEILRQNSFIWYIIYRDGYC